MLTMKMRLFLATVAVALTPLTALAQVSISDAWVRGTVPGQKVTGAFMQITSATDASLVAVTSPVAKVAEIHTMSHEGGVMKMRRVEAIALPAGKPVELGPGGYHVMLMDVGQALKEGDKVPLTLTFADKAGNRTTQAVSATVRALAAPAHKH
jgi:periplasmic copper chaperone A